LLPLGGCHIRETRQQQKQEISRVVLSDANIHTGRDEIEELNDVLISQPHASVAGWLADQVFSIGAVNVDEAISGVGILLIETLQPENTREHSIVLATWSPHLACGKAAAENAPRLGCISMFLKNAKSSGGCLEASWFRPEAELGSRDRPRLDRDTIREKMKGLVRDIHMEC